MPRSYPLAPRVALLGGGLAVALLAPLVPLAPAAAQEASPTASAGETQPTATPSSAGTAAPTETPSPTAAPTGTPTPGATETPSPTPDATGTPAPTATTTAPPASPSPGPPAEDEPVLRLGVSTALVRGTGQLVVSARMYRAANSPAVGVALDVLGRTPGSTGWARLGRATTDASGLATLALVPRVTREYAVRTTTTPVLLSGTRTVAVQPLLSGRLTPRVTQVGRTGVVTGSLVPAYAGAKVLVQRRAGTGWRTVRTVVPAGNGVYRAVLGGDALGRHVYRAHLAAAPAHRAATSPLLERVVEGRSLRQGDRGPDVTSLQQRLVAQKVDVGRVDGVFGYDLRHAVTAFQKSQGLPRTGVYDKATSARLASPRPVRLRHPAKGRAVEVDITKQVLYVSEGGRLTRIVDVSTGNDQPYVSQGVQYRAFTPTGRYSVQRKINGIRVSHLGELYRPAYFHRGWAIHGSPNVPVYPDSHGCVRVTNGAMDRLYGLLGIGVPVSLYRS